MNLVVVSAPGKLENEANIINEMFASGLAKLHLRKPDWTVMEIISFLKGIHQDYLPQIALHQHHEMSVDFGIRHLHFKESNRSGICDLLFQSFKDSGYILSSSIHDLEVLKMQVFDYVFFGPVFDSISKVNYKGKITPDFNLKEIETSTKVYAIGGVSENNITLLDRIGFDGAALLGSIWTDPVKALINFETINKLCN